MSSSFWFRAELDPAAVCHFGTDAQVMVADLGFLALGSTIWVRAVQRDDAGRASAAAGAIIRA